MRTRSCLSLLALALFTAACADHSPVNVPDAPDTEHAGDHATHAAAAGCALGVEAVVVEATIAGLIDQVDALEADGVLNDGQARALRTHLENARAHLEAGRVCPARAMLNAFREQVAGFRAAGILRDRHAAPLLERARLLLSEPPPPGETPRMYAPGVFGELRTVQFDGRDLTYEVIDGLAIFQSDVILGYADEFEQWIAGQGAGGASSDPTIARSGACQFDFFSCQPWTGEVVGYAFANDWGGPTTNMMMIRNISQAMQHWEANTGIRFEHRTSGDRVVFRNSTGCSSHVGRRIFTGTDPQWVNLATGCGVGTIIHEIAHAVGIWHEQSRDDRDNHVKINWDLIQEGREHNFEKYGGGGFDVGPYDFFSLMHYACTLFRRDGATGNTLEPIDPDPEAPGCDQIGMAGGLSDGDILGVYTLYPTAFDITGATPGETRDRFTLGLAFSRSPVQREDFIEWTSDRVPGETWNGLTLSTREAGLPSGRNLITARVVILGTTLAERSIVIDIFNHPPVVDLGPDRDVDLNREFSVVATVTDVEDGTCPIGVCTYTWSPAPRQDLGTRAVYRYTSVGPRAISLTVEDGGGAVVESWLNVTVVNSPPVPVMDVPVGGSTITGSILHASGYATDLNEGPGPGPGLLPCWRLAWSSSDPTDSFTPNPDNCAPTLAFGGSGVRTIKLTATDPQGLSASVEATITVADCGANCPPDLSFIIDTPPELNGAVYLPPFTGPGYYLRTPLKLEGRIGDADVPPDNPVAFEWRLARPCFNPDPSACPADTVLGQGTVNVPEAPGTSTVTLNWTPEDTIAEWDACVSTALPHTIRLWARDARGATNIFSRTIHLACDLR
jgi:hypothetical protein